jgi:hypothetical protein
VIPSAWLNQLDRVKNEIFHLYHHRQIWREMRLALLEASPDEQVFLDHYARLYADRQVVAIRRLIDPDRGTQSIYGLTTKLADQPSLLSRQRWVSFFEQGENATDEQWIAMAHAQFDRTADPKRPDRVDPSIMATFAAELKEDLHGVNTYVDKVVAHMDATRTPPSLTWVELDEAIDLLGQTFKQVFLMLTASTMWTLEPQIQTDWKRPFRTPLFPPIPEVRWPPADSTP